MHLKRIAEESFLEKIFTKVWTGLRESGLPKGQQQLRSVFTPRPEETSRGNASLNPERVGTIRLEL